jgi:hypothetical protein
MPLCRSPSNVISLITRRISIARRSTMRMGITTANRTASRERIEWAAVKRSDVKVGNSWIAKSKAGM